MITVDTTQFNAAMRLYQQATRKDMGDVINRAAGNLALWGSHYIPRTDKSRVMADTSGGETGKFGKPELFVRFVVKLLREQGYKIRRNRKAKEGEQSQGYIDKSTGQWVARRKFVSYTREYKGTVGKELTPSQFWGIVRRIVKKRLATIGGLRATLGYVALQFGARADRFARKISLRSGRIQRANPNNWAASFAYQFKDDRTPLEGSRKVVGQRAVDWRMRTTADALDRAVRRVALDMKWYAERKLAEQAARISARKAA